MKNIFKEGDSKTINFLVKEEDVASFNGQVVHRVCSTFSLAREIEWATRQFVLEMRDDDEEGIGTFININHQSPAFIGDTIKIDSKIEAINGHEIICSYTAQVNERVVADGKTGQKILKREKLVAILSKK